MNIDDQKEGNDNVGLEEAAAVLSKTLSVNASTRFW
jgi:hypothetical protein